MPTDDEDIPPEYRGVGGPTPTNPRNEPLPLPNAVHDQIIMHSRGTSVDGLLTAGDDE